MKTPSRRDLLEVVLAAARTDAPSPVEVERLKRTLATSASLVGASSLVSTHAAASTVASSAGGATSGAASASASALGSTALTGAGSVAAVGAVSKVIVITALGLGSVGVGSFAYVQGSELSPMSGQPVSPPPTLVHSPAPRAEPLFADESGSSKTATRTENTSRNSTKVDRFGALPRTTEPSKTPRAMSPTVRATHAVQGRENEANNLPISRTDLPEMSSKRSDALREAELIEAARRLVGQSPSETLVLLERHAVEFPRGVLGMERRVLTIEALTNLGRQSEAKRALDAFRRDYPSSVHMRRLESATHQLKP